ncbi:MAG: T9SS type A sorting domain-containing protein, partial [Bacteroidales bacterium]|nr:T9SS type A sorting domain-containing protein [Bacteroidales bacterium]
YDVNIDNNNDILIIGSFKETVDFDPSEGTYYLYGSGFTANTFVGKYSTLGSIIWAFSISTNSNPNIGYSVSSDISNNIFIGGYFSDTADFDPSGANYLIPANNPHGYFAGYSTDRQFQWAYRIGDHTDLIYSVLSHNSCIYLCGYFGYEFNFDLFGGENILYTGIYSSTAFIAKYSGLTNEELDIKNDLFSVFPNPFTESINIIGKPIKSVEVFSVSGILINSFSTNTDNNQNVLNLSFLKEGLYILKLVDINGNSLSKKLIKL